MKLLITGGCGFIGSNFIRYILNKYNNYKIINLDLMTYAGKGNNLQDIEMNKNYSFIKEDICSRNLFYLFDYHTFDAIINFAAETHVDRSIDSATEFVRTNVLGTQNLLNIIKKYKIPRAIFISTDEVYGSLGVDGKFSEMNQIKPSSPYAASKASSDLLVLASFKTHKQPVIITRCSNNYGPYQYPEKLIPLLVTNAIEGIDLPIYGNGLNVRDWIHVLDHCKAIDLVLHKGVEGEIYNIGGNSERTNLYIAKKIIEYIGKGNIKFVEDRKGHDFRYAIDYSKIQKELGWEPSYNFENGLKETVEWYKNNKNWWYNLKYIKQN